MYPVLSIVDQVNIKMPSKTFLRVFRKLVTSEFSGRPFEVQNLNVFQETARADVDNVVISKIELAEIAEWRNAVEVGRSTTSHPQYLHIVETTSQVSVATQGISNITTLLVGFVVDIITGNVTNQINDNYWHHMYYISDPG